MPLIALVPLLLAAGVLPSHAQSAAAFEVASVKQNTSGEDRAFFTPNAGRVYINNAPLRDIIARALGLDPSLDRFLLIGGSADILSARFDITAKAPDDAPPGQELAMLRTLLSERFKLRTHSETRSIPIYAVTVASEGRLGSQIRRSSHDCVALGKARSENPDADLQEPRDSAGRPLCRSTYEFNTPGPGAITLRYAGPIDVLVNRMQAFVDRPLVDATDLTGSFEWVLSFSRTGAFDSPVPSIFTAVQEQLGLKLDRQEGPVEVVIIDSVEFPTPN